MEKRIAFTDALAYLLLYIINEGGQPILDEVMRTTAEQKRRYEMGLTPCDGLVNPSPHQFGLAAHISLLPENDDHASGRLERLHRYHDFWVQLGGKPLDGERYRHYEWK